MCKQDYVLVGPPQASGYYEQQLKEMGWKEPSTFHIQTETNGLSDHSRWTDALKGHLASNGQAMVLVCGSNAQEAKRVRKLLEAAGLSLPLAHEAIGERTGRLLVPPTWDLESELAEGLRRNLYWRFFKRPLECLLVLLLTPFALPISWVASLLVRRRSPGPWLYTQRRVGMGGKEFKMRKLRTMHLDADTKDNGHWTIPNDERVIAGAEHLRLRRIDELPQFANVLFGDMSLVGPRPEQPQVAEMLRETIGHYDCRHLVRPGITGWAQINWGYDTSAESAAIKLSYDLYYLRHLSFWLDLKILLKTPLVMLKGFGAH